MPEETRRMYPPRRSSLWEIISASAGASRSVTISRRETLIDLNAARAEKLTSPMKWSKF